MPCPSPSTSCRPSSPWPVSRNRRTALLTGSTCHPSSSNKKLYLPARSTGARFPTTAPAARRCATALGNWSCNIPRPNPAPSPTNKLNCSAWTRTSARKTTWPERNQSGLPPCSSNSRHGMPKLRKLPLTNRVAGCRGRNSTFHSSMAKTSPAGRLPR